MKNESSFLTVRQAVIEGSDPSCAGQSIRVTCSTIEDSGLIFKDWNATVAVGRPARLQPWYFPLTKWRVVILSPMLIEHFIVPGLRERWIA